MRRLHPWAFALSLGYLVATSGCSSKGSSDSRDGGSAKADGAEVSAGSLVYASSYGVGQLRLLPPGKEPVALTPNRGRHWNGFEGRPFFKGISPDERWALVCLENNGLFAVATDASTADGPLFITEMECGDHAYFSSDGDELLFTRYSRSQLSRVRFDPHDPGAAVVLVDTGMVGEIGSVQQVRDDWAYDLVDSAGGRSLFVVSPNAAEPRPVIPQIDSSQWIVKVGLEDGHVVLRADGVSYVVSLEDGSASAIAPPVEGLELIALVDDGQRFIAVAWMNGVRSQLWSVRVDGSDATAPVVLTAEYARTPVFLPNARRTISRIGAVTHEVAWDGSEPPRTYSTRQNIVPMGVSQDERWMYGCLGDQVQRLDRQAQAPEWLPSADAVELLAEHPSIQVYANRYWSCGDAILPTPGGQKLEETIAAGHLELPATIPVTDALYLRAPSGERRRLSVEHEVAILEAHLPAEADRVLYGMHSARLNGADRGQEVTFQEEPALELALVANDTPVYLRPTEVPGNNDLLVPGYRAGEVGFRVLARSVWRSDPPIAFRNSLLVVRDAGVWLTPMDGTEPKLLLDQAPTPQEWDLDGPWPSLLVDEHAEQVIAASGGKLLAFSLDGSEAASPRVLLEELPANYHWPRAVLGEDALFYTYDDQRSACGSCVGVSSGAAWAVSLNGTDTTPRAIEPGPLFIDKPRKQNPISRGPFVSVDKRWALAIGDEQLKLVPLPVGSGQELMVEGPRPTRPLVRAPGADFAVAHVDGRLWRVPLSPDESNRALATVLTPEVDTVDMEPVYWLDDNESLLFNVQIDRRHTTVRVSTRGDTAHAWDILAGGQQGNESVLEALAPDGSWFVFTRGVPSRGLMGARFGQAPFALTDDTDTFERFIAWTR